MSLYFICNKPNSQNFLLRCKTLQPCLSFFVNMYTYTQYQLSLTANEVTGLRISDVIQFLFVQVLKIIFTNFCCRISYKLQTRCFINRWCILLWGKTRIFLHNTVPKGILNPMSHKKCLLVHVKNFVHLLAKHFQVEKKSAALQ